MTTWAQIIDGHALNVVVGSDLSATLAQNFAPGFDGGYPGVLWQEVPDGTLSGAKNNGEGTFSNPSEEPSAPLTLTKLEFVTLCQNVGGMTDAKLVSAKADAQLAALWIKLDMATSVERDNQITDAGLDALAALSYLPNGKVAVIAAWPTN